MTKDITEPDCTMANNNGNPTLLERLARGDGLAMAVQDANGDSVYSNNKAQMGFLAANKFLLVGKSFVDANKSYEKLDVNVKRFGERNGVSKYMGETGTAFARAHPYIVLSDAATDADAVELQYLKLAAMNYMKLIAAGIEPPNAYVAAGLRARWILMGAWQELVADTNTLYVEHVIVGGEGDASAAGGVDRANNIAGVLTAMGNYAEGFAAEHFSDDHGTTFITRHADAFWALSEHLFRTKGHHYKNGPSEEYTYRAFVDRYLTAAYEGNFEWPNALDRFVVFHTAIHPFKIRALVTLTAKLIAHGTISNAGLIRLSGAPVGTAVITTTYAALDTMRAEAWYSPFNTVYTNEIRELESFASQIQDNRYGFHMASRLYGVDSVRLVTSPLLENSIEVEQAKSRVSAIAAAAQGMISALNQAVEVGAIAGFALSNARSLEKAASANPLLSMRINTLVTKAVDSVTEARTLNDAITNALPMLPHSVADEE